MPQRRGPRPGHANKKFEPTDQQRTFVARAMAYGIPQPQIWQLVINPETGLPISESTFRRAFPEQIERGLSETVHAVATSLVRSAVRGNVIAQIFFLKARAGWKETNVVESWVGGIPGKPVEVRISARDQLYETLDEMAGRRRAVAGGHPLGTKPNGAGPSAEEAEDQAGAPDL
jgi:hypothetical protein